MEFQEIEKSDAVRLTWNIWPHSRVEATKCVIPFAALYTPNRVLENMPVRSWLQMNS
jgi:protein transport protein SEC23